MTNTPKTMYEAACELTHAEGGMLLNKILIQDITREMEHFSEEATNVRQDLAQFYMAEVQSKLRLLTTLLQVLEKDMIEEHEALVEISTYIFNEMRKPQAEQGSHVYPFIDTKKAQSVQG